MAIMVRAPADRSYGPCAAYGERLWNLKTATALGRAISHDFPLNADEVIE